MKEKWQTKKLGEVCDILDNRRKPVTQRDRISGNYPYYGATGIQDYVSEYIFDEKLILIGEDGAKWGAGENTAFTADGKYWVNNHAHVIRPYRDKVLDNWIIYYLNFNDLSKHITGLTVRKLNQGKLREILIPMPQLSEQQRIVKILDEVFENIANAKENAEKNLANSKELFESYLQSIFTKSGKDWKNKKIADIIQKTETINPTKKPEEKILYIDVSSVNKDTKQIENPTSIIGNNAPSRARKLIKTDDIIFATIRPTHSRVAIVSEEYNNQVCSTGYFVLRTKDFIDSKFVYYFLLTKGFNKQMEKLQKGASYPAVNDNDVKGVNITFPISLLEQKSIVTKLDALFSETKKLELIYKQKIELLEELKKSILIKAFSGEL